MNVNKRPQRRTIFEASTDKGAILLAALAKRVGILINNARVSDVNPRMASVENRMGSMENRISNLDHKFDTRFDLLLSKVVDIDNRLTRFEPRH